MTALDWSGRGRLTHNSVRMAERDTTTRCYWRWHAERRGKPPSTVIPRLGPTRKFQYALLRRGAGSAARHTSPPPRGAASRQLSCRRGGGGGGRVAVRRKASDASARAKGKSEQSRRSRPPWGNLLGGKPIERQLWFFDKKIERAEIRLRNQQLLKMQRLKRYYGIVGGDYELPIQGVGPADWLPWYELALCIASDLDKSLQIIDTPKPGRTTPRWRGLEGEVLVDLVERERETHPRRSIQWCLGRVQKRIPGLARMPFRQLIARYHEAKRRYEAAARMKATS